MAIEIREHIECEEWDEESDTGYCRNCGGTQLVHDGNLDRLFDSLNR
jgi:hypothetical protein